MNNQDWKPWEWYPEIWPTESKFWTWLRGCLRNAVWNKSPIKIIHKNENCFPPPDGYTGKAKSGNYCALSGEWTGKSKLQSDHIIGNVSLLGEEDILNFIKHLVPPPGSLQLVSPDAHKIKSYAEKMGITYEDAVVEKKAIEFCKKKVDEQKALLLQCNPQANVSNAESRREEYRKLIKEKKFEPK